MIPSTPNNFFSPPTLLADMKPLLFTTVVGSFPLTNTSENMAKAFRGQIEAGITHPCYPQLVSMTAQFLAPLNALTGAFELRAMEYFLLNDFEVPSAPFALEYGKFVVDFLARNPALAKKIQGTKACLTGPFTLSGDVLLEENGLGQGVKKQIFSEPRAIMVESLVPKFATLLGKIAKAYSDMGFQIISMDEPTLSLMVGRKTYIFHKKDFILEQLNTAMVGIKGWPSVHVCGRLAPLLRDLLLESRAKILDHEFVSWDQNWDIYSRQDLEKHDKYLAVGAVSSKVTADPGKTKPADYVESLDFIESIIMKAINLFGADRVMIKPDCGLGGLKGTFPDSFAYEIAIGKLRNLCSALANVRQKMKI